MNIIVVTDEKYELPIREISIIIFSIDSATREIYSTISHHGDSMVNNGMRMMSYNEQRFNIIKRPTRKKMTSSTLTCDVIIEILSSNIWSMCEDLDLYSDLSSS